MSVMTIDGDVVAAHSFWTADGARIVTEATVRTPDGQDVVVRQVGGTVDGVALVQLPGPPILELGMRVAIAAHRGLDLSQREHIMLDSVKVLDYAPGFVRTVGVTGKPLYWESGCAFVTLDAAGTTAIAGDQEFAVIEATLEIWNQGTKSCSYLTLKSDGRKSGIDPYAKDHINLIKFWDTGCADCPGGTWCRPATHDAAAECHSPNAAALTTVSYIKEGPREAAIVDADIELNGVDFAISVDGNTLSEHPCHAELKNTLAHELGHLQGLEHPCRTSGDPPRKDDQGQDVPFCGMTSDPKILDATMFNFQDCGEDKKESLTPDDIAGICRSYPEANDPKECLHVGEDAGCCSASGRPDVSILLAGTTVLLMLRRRKTFRSA